MSEKREALKGLLRGGYNVEGMGFDVDLWPYLDRDEYNARALEACLRFVRWERDNTGSIDRRTRFYAYILEMRAQGYSAEI